MYYLNIIKLEVIIWKILINYVLNILHTKNKRYSFATILAIHFCLIYGHEKGRGLMAKHTLLTLVITSSNLKYCHQI